MRKIFPLAVKNLMSKNKKIFCLLGDIGVFSFREVFKNFRNRIINMSTMEQSMLGFGAGLAKTGFIPIIHSISPFIILRALEQIKIDFVYNKLPCNIVTVGASNDYAELGTTHQCYEDINILSNYNKINIFIPSNADEFRYLFEKNYNNRCVNYFRLSESSSKKVLRKNTFIKLNNNNNLLICVGFHIKTNYIKNKLDVYYINTINKKINLNFIKKYKKIIIIEPFFGNIIEREIRKRNLIKNKIYTINYNETIVYKYGNKTKQDNYLKFNEHWILKKINAFIKKKNTYK